MTKEPYQIGFSQLPDRRLARCEIYLPLDKRAGRLVLGKLHISPASNDLLFVGIFKNGVSVDGRAFEARHGDVLVMKFKWTGAGEVPNIFAMLSGELVS